MLYSILGNSSKTYYHQTRHKIMPAFSVNTHRTNPYKNFKFRIKWNGKYVAGISKISPLKRSTEVIEYRDGANSNNIQKMPGFTKYEHITLERGVTHDTEFENWANQVFNISGNKGSEMSLKNFRRDIVLEMFNEAGVLVISYLIRRCWISEYVALPEFDANSFAVAIEKITLENEGWERDLSVKEPSES